MECTLIKHFSSIFKWLHWGYEIYIERAVSMLLLPHLPIQSSQQYWRCYYLSIIWWGKACHIPCRKVNPFSSSTLNTLADRNYVWLTLNKLIEFFVRKRMCFYSYGYHFFFCQYVLTDNELDYLANTVCYFTLLLKLSYFWPFRNIFSLLLCPFDKFYHYEI